MINKRRFLFSVLIFTLSCGKLPESLGKSREVGVVSVVVDTALINANLQIYNYYPQKEPQFFFVFGPDTDIKKFHKFRTIFLYGSLENNFIKKLLNAEAREATKKDEIVLFRKSDLWAKNQLVLILAVSEPQMLWNAVKEYHALIVRILDDNYFRNVKAEYNALPRDEKTIEELKQHGITFDLPKGWLIDTAHAREKFLLIRAHDPDRSVFYYRARKPVHLSDTFAIKIRNILTEKYYHGDYILKDRIRAEPYELDNLKGIRLQGAWQNDSLVAGGPFLAYFLTDSINLYVIDGALFLPGERKTDYFKRVEVLLNSFKLETSNPGEGN
jgi:hypothetical protein